MIPNKKFALDQLENFVHTMHKNEVAAEVFGALMVVKEAEAGAAHEAAMQFVTQRPVLSAVNTDNFQKQVQKMNSAQIDTSNPKNYSNLYYTTAPALTDVVIRLSKESFRKKLKAMSVIEVAELSCDIAEKNALSFTELQYLLTPDRVELKNTARIRSIKQQAKIGYGTVFTNDLQMGQSIMQMSVDFFMAREKQIGGVSTEGAMKKLFTYQPKFKDYFTADGKSRAPMPPKPQTNFYVPNISGGPGGL